MLVAAGYWARERAVAYPPGRQQCLKCVFRLIAPGKQGHHQPDPPCSAPLVTGDYCYVIADTFGIDLETLQGINPQLNCELIQPSESF